MKLAQLLCFCAVLSGALSAQNSSISKRFVPFTSSAALDGQWALWQNPAGLAFLQGMENSLGYLYEFNKLGNRHHGGALWAVNFWDSLSLGFGLNCQKAFSKTAQENFGTDLNGIFGAALNLGKRAGFGISFLKSHSFKNSKTSDTLISFGLQARATSYLSFGANYEEVYNGFFMAPNLTLGFAARPFGEWLTFAVDGRLTALEKNWDSFRFDPILGLKSEIGGIAASIQAEIPGLKSGWTRPIFSLGAEFNFKHLGFNLAGLINKADSNYGVGGSIRSSTAEWKSLAKTSDFWVELSVNSKGALTSHSPGLLSHFLGEEPKPLAVLALLRRIKNDPMIKGVIIYIDGFSFGDGRAQEWRNAIKALSDAKKEVVVYLAAPSERDYYVATAANQIYMNPYTTMSFQRFQKTLVYFADLLKKIGVQAESISAGQYKTAPRPFTKSVAQKEEIEVYNHILESFYDALLDEASASRNISKDKLKEIFDIGEITAVSAQEYGLVDKLIFKDQVLETIGTGKGLRVFPNYEDRTFKRYAWNPPKKIAVIPIRGEIVSGRVFPSILPLFGLQTGAKDVEDEIESAVLDPDVAAIIVRIDSPGGESGAGEAINRALIKAQESKIIVTSMSDVAASAGYMIAAGTNYILAEKNTITGSIGVFSLHFSGAELAKKIGVNATELSPIKNPGPTIFRAMSSKEKEQAQKIIDWTYQNFISIVATGLKLDESYVKQNANGRVWLGEEAFHKKLINEIGGFSEAIDAARSLAKLPDDEDLEVEIKQPGSSETFSLGARLTKFFKSPAMVKELVNMAPLARPYIKALECYRLNGIPQARLPFDFERKAQE